MRAGPQSGAEKRRLGGAGRPPPGRSSIRKGGILSFHSFLWRTSRGRCGERRGSGRHAAVGQAA